MNRCVVLRTLALSCLSVAGLLPCRAALAQRVDGAVLEAGSPVQTGHVETVAFTGSVRLPGGGPAAEAVVVSSAGGQAVTDARGRFRIEVPVSPGSPGVASVQVTAAGHAGRSMMTSRRVALEGIGDERDIGPMTLAVGSVCTPVWLPTFGGEPGASDVVRALTVFDDGTGPALYAGGDFRFVSGIAADYIARWDGSRWTPVGGGMDGVVLALTVFDDGTGPALYAGGEFATAGGVAANTLAKWDGESWSAFASSPNGTGVSAIAEFDDGGGAELYIAGSFTAIGGVAANGIARWDGSTWSPLDFVPLSGPNGSICCLVVYDDGFGDDLYAGGTFTLMSGIPASRVASYNGTSWSLVGSGANDNVRAMTVFDDGNGEELYIGGVFTLTGTQATGAVNTRRIAKWNGLRWAAVGVGSFQTVEVLSVVDEGGASVLYAGGRFVTIGGTPARHVARYDGTTWTALGSGVELTPDGSPGGSNVLAVASFDDGSGPVLYVGGFFGRAGAVASTNLARWDGSTWSANGPGLNRDVAAMEVFDDGNGPALYVAGDFTQLAGVQANRIIRWDGVSWTPLQQGVDGRVNALTVFDDGSGSALYVGGMFTNAGGAFRPSVAKWDGTSWSSVASPGSGVNALAVYDDGSGATLYAGGNFLRGVFRWDGIGWLSLGEGVNGPVNALEVFDDGSGTALFVGGNFTIAGSGGANRVAAWDGTSWSSLGTGTDGTVSALRVFDDGTGDALYAGGFFLNAGGAGANSLARWDGAGWSPVGTGLANGTNNTVRALEVYDDGAGDVLFVGGDFTDSAGEATNFLSRWDGNAWSAAGSGTSGAVLALQPFDDGGGEALFVGGAFDSVFESGDSYLGRWRCEKVFTSFCDATDGALLSCPCANPGLPDTGCDAPIGPALGGGLTGGVRLDVAGQSFPPNRATLTGSGYAGAPAAVVIRAPALNPSGPLVFGDGLRCVALPVVRLGAAVSSGGLSTHVFGHGAGPGAFYYQLWYRSTPASYCSPDAFNLSNGRQLVW